jgi:Leucine-rich repeat (LRR) protein
MDSEMKKIQTTIILSILILSQPIFAEGTFNMTIPQPDFVSNDWDGDGEINSIDTDDDGDGILDVDDDIPFGGTPGGSGTGESSYAYSGDDCSDGSIEESTVNALNTWFNRTISTHNSAYYCEPTRKTLWFGSNINGIVPEEIGALTYIEEIANNNGALIISLPDSIANLSDLRLLEIRDQGLTELPSTIGYLKNLTRINLRNNNIASLPDSIGSLTNLTTFYLQGNNLTSLPTTMGGLTSVKTLYMEDNQLTSLPVGFGGMSSLETMTANDNLISTVPEDFGNLNSAIYIRLDGNQLSTVPDSLNNLPFANMTGFYLYGNPGSTFSNIDCSAAAACGK